jgi:hypothetical protein
MSDDHPQSGTRVIRSRRIRGNQVHRDRHHRPRHPGLPGLIRRPGLRLSHPTIEDLRMVQVPKFEMSARG